MDCDFMNCDFVDKEFKAYVGKLKETFKFLELLDLIEDSLNNLNTFERNLEE